MSRYWTETVRRLTPYRPGEQRAGVDIVKLNTNENPYPPSSAVLDAIADVDGHALRRYPDPESIELRTALADYHHLEVDQVFVGNGSDEILALAFLAYFTGGSSLQYPKISYSFYPVYCDLYGIRHREVPLANDFVLDTSRYIANAGGICFPNPNAPTGRSIGIDEIRRLLERHTEFVVLVDEAYADFGADSAIPLIAEFPNLLVSRTFSKGRSLAGLRLGAAFGHTSLIDGLQRVKNSFNSYPVDVLAQRAGLASLGDEPSYRSAIERICATRSRLGDALRERRFEVLPSMANFVFARPPDGTVQTLFERLSEQGVLVRHWSTPSIRDWLRITVGTDDEVGRLLAVIDESLE